MRKFDVLYNFISPVTGRVLITTDYILVGDDNGIAKESNLLLSSTFIIKTSNSQLPNAETLDTTIYSTSATNSGSSPPGIAKIEVDGSITIAVPGTDYAVPIVSEGDYVLPTIIKDYIDKMIKELEERLLNSLKKTLDS